MRPEEIAVLDLESLKLHAEHALSQLKVAGKFLPNPHIETLQHIIARYDLELTQEPTQFAARELAKRRLEQMQDWEIGR